MTSALSDGRTSVITSSMPTSAATARGGRVVAREQHAPHSERLAWRDGARGGWLDGVGDDEHAADLAVPRGHDGGAAVGLGGPPGGVELGGNVKAPPGHQRRAADLRAMAVDDALDAEPFTVGEALDGGQLGGLGLGRAGDGMGDRMFGGPRGRRRCAAPRRRSRLPWCRSRLGPLAVVTASAAWDTGRSRAASAQPRPPTERTRCRTTTRLAVSRRSGRQSLRPPSWCRSPANRNRSVRQAVRSGREATSALTTPRPSLDRGGSRMSAAGQRDLHPP
jgi:hypothetical protein